MKEFFYIILYSLFERFIFFIKKFINLVYKSLSEYFYKLAVDYRFFLLLLIFFKKLLFFFKIFMLHVMYFVKESVCVILVFIINFYYTIYNAIIFFFTYICECFLNFILICHYWFYKYLWVPFMVETTIMFWKVMLFLYRIFVYEFNLFCEFLYKSLDEKDAAKRAYDAKRAEYVLWVKVKRKKRPEYKKGDYKLFRSFKLFFFYLYFDFVSPFFNKFFRFFFRIVMFIYKHSIVLRVLFWPIKFTFKLLFFFQYSRRFLKLIYFSIRIILKIIVYIFFGIIVSVILFCYIFFFIFFFFFNFNFVHFIMYLNTVYSRYYYIFCDDFRTCFNALFIYYEWFFKCFFYRIFKVPIFELNVHKYYVCGCFLIYWFNLFGIYTITIIFYSFLFFPSMYTILRVFFFTGHYFDNFLWNYVLSEKKCFPEHNIYYTDFQKPLTAFDIFLKNYFIGDDFRSFLDFVQSIDFLLYIYDNFNMKFWQSLESFNECVLCFNPLLDPFERDFYHFNIYLYFKSFFEPNYERITKPFFDEKGEDDEDIWKAYKWEYIFKYRLFFMLKYFFIEVIPYFAYVFVLFIRVHFKHFRLNLRIKWYETIIYISEHKIWWVRYFLIAFYREKRIRECTKEYIYNTFMYYRSRIILLRFYNYFTYRTVTIIIKIIQSIVIFLNSPSFLKVIQMFFVAFCLVSIFLILLFTFFLFIFFILFFYYLIGFYIFPDLIVYFPYMGDFCYTFVMGEPFDYNLLIDGYIDSFTLFGLGFYFSPFLLLKWFYLSKFFIFFFFAFVINVFFNFCYGSFFVICFSFLFLYFFFWLWCKFICYFILNNLLVVFLAVYLFFFWVIYMQYLVSIIDYILRLK